MERTPAGRTQPRLLGAKLESVASAISETQIRTRPEFSMAMPGVATALEAGCIVQLVASGAPNGPGLGRAFTRDFHDALSAHDVRKDGALCAFRRRRRQVRGHNPRVPQ